MSLVSLCGHAYGSVNFCHLQCKEKEMGVLYQYFPEEEQVHLSLAACFVARIRSLVQGCFPSCVEVVQEDDW
eukprot:5045854-Amphidinium_carterae.1